MQRFHVLQVLPLTLVLAACAGRSGLCIPGGSCVPRYPDARLLADANLAEYEDIGALASNLGLPDINPDTVCEAAVSDANLDDVQDAISDVMADNEWDNMIGWDYGSSIWQNKNSYSMIYSWNLDPNYEEFGRHTPPLEKLGVQASELGGARTLTITCGFKQPAR